jgi:myo-inositol-1(or 4)-monophosphatase
MSHTTSVSATTMSSSTLMTRTIDYSVPKALLDSPYGAEIDLAVALALAAGANMISYCDSKGTQAEDRHDLGIATKGQPEDFCTKIDIENENLVTVGIQERFPEHKVIGEETVGTGAIPPLTAEPTWIIDPIDGTTNFASGLPLTCVSIGFCVEQKPVMGVAYAPMTGELYLAVKGHGAYRNGVKLSHRASKLLVDSVVCFELGYGREPDRIAAMLTGVRRILEHGCRTTRQLGSGVLDLCYVATGRLDVVYAGVAGEGWKPWDYCAAVVIAQETGCVLETLDPESAGKDFDIYGKSVICAVSPELAKELRLVVTGAKP